MNKFLPFFLFLITVLVFFWQFIFLGKLPIPADTIVGMYHPFRDFYAKDYPRGIPFKNSLITDPVRQQYPWKKLAIEQLKNGQLPLWNRYSFAGVPLTGNFQSAAFYPLNIIFFILNFNFAWGLFILLQPLLAAIFMYLYLQNLKLDKKASFIGGIVFAFSGFSVAWLEWGNMIHTALWLPLILLSIDKILIFKNIKLKSKNLLLWCMVFIFSIISAFFAGHLQIFFYLFVFAIVYFLLRLLYSDKKFSKFFLFSGLGVVFAAITSVQWLPTLQFIMLSARQADQADWHKAGWFIPWQNLIQFVLPDFFGNPATLNYWGIWNYGEFIGYAGILSLIMVFYALFFRRDKKTLFFGVVLFLSLFLAFPSIFAKIPYKYGISFLSTSQPTRFMFIADVAISVLAALGFDYFLKNKKKLIYPLGFFSVFFIAVWIFVLAMIRNQNIYQNMAIAKQNLIFPTIVFLILTIIFSIIIFFKRAKNFTNYLVFLTILILIADLLRFGWKYTAFVKEQYLFPKTKILSFLTQQKGQFRIMSTDSRILPPNFSVFYKLKSVDGYDPLYLLNYGEFIAALNREKPDIHEPFGFNRIITPQNYLPQMIDLLGVKYVLSLESLKNSKLKEITREGEVKLYENKNVFPRAFFVSKVYFARNRQDSINAIFKFQTKNKLKDFAIVEDFNSKDNELHWKFDGSAPEILEDKDNYIIIRTNNKNDGFMVLADNFYPTWYSKIDGQETRIYRTDFTFRGIMVPKGEHKIEFLNKLF